MDYQVDDFVRLTRDIPDHLLRKGSVGVIRSIWFSPSTRYEVEFHPVGEEYEARCLLTAESLQPEDEPEQESHTTFSEADDFFVLS